MLPQFSPGGWERVVVNEWEEVAMCLLSPAWKTLTKRWSFLPCVVLLCQCVVDTAHSTGQGYWHLDFLQEGIKS